MGNTVHMETASCMMTSSNGNIFRVTGPLCGDSLVTGAFPAQRPVTQSFDVFFGLHLNQQLSKQWRRWWFETPSHPLWRHCNGKIGWCQHIILILYYAVNIFVVASGISPKNQSSRSLHLSSSRPSKSFQLYLIYICSKTLAIRSCILSHVVFCSINDIWRLSIIT